MMHCILSGLLANHKLSFVLQSLPKFFFSKFLTFGHDSYALQSVLTLNSSNIAALSLML